MKKEDLIHWLDYCYEELSNSAGVISPEESRVHFYEAYLALKDIILNRERKKFFRCGGEVFNTP